jgi:hypothetical protein
LWLAGQQLLTMLSLLSSLFRTSAELRLENLALRHQLGVLRRSAPKQLKLTPADRILWVWLRRVWRAFESVGSGRFLQEWRLDLWPEAWIPTAERVFPFFIEHTGPNLQE